MKWPAIVVLDMKRMTRHILLRHLPGGAWMIHNDPGQHPGESPAYILHEDKYRTPRTTSRRIYETEY